MTKYLLIINALGVCKLVCASYQALPQAAVEVSEIICKPGSAGEGGTDAVYSDFNRVVSKYFAENFGPGGEKYLTDFGEFGECGQIPIYLQFFTEIENIVAPSHNWIFGKKSGDVRFRIHRYLGILMLFRQKRGFAADQLTIDYHKAFKDDDRKRFDEGLRALKGLTHKLIRPPGTHRLTRIDEFEDDKEFVTLVSDCLRLIGEFTTYADGTVVQYSTEGGSDWHLFPLILNTYNEVCLHGSALPMGEIDAEQRPELCRGIRLLLRNPTDAKTRWDHAVHYLKKLTIAKRMGSRVEYKQNVQDWMKTIHYISVYGRGAQVVDCLRVGGNTFAHCLDLGESQLALAVGELSKGLDSAACDDSLKRFPELIPIVHTLLCLKCEFEKESSVIPTKEKANTAIGKCMI